LVEGKREEEGRGDSVGTKLVVARDKMAAELLVAPAPDEGDSLVFRPDPKKARAAPAQWSDPKGLVLRSHREAAPDPAFSMLIGGVH
jgi:hypothetical protein